MTSVSLSAKYKGETHGTSIDVTEQKYSKIDQGTRQRLNTGGYIP